MIDGVNNLGIRDISKAATGSSMGPSAAGESGTIGNSFADALKQSIGEVSRMQQDATKAVEDLATGKNENVTNVMTAVEKADLAFKTLLAIRTKLMEAYDELKNIPL